MSAHVPRKYLPRGKTSCHLCGLSVWSYHLHRHLRQAHFLGSRPPAENYMSPHPNHPTNLNRYTPHASQAATFSSHTSQQSSSSSSSSSSENDGIWDDDTCQQSQAAISVEHYIEQLGDAYNPKEVVKYLSWANRALTLVETEVLRFLRVISFGEGLSQAQTKEMLEYVRSLGGIINTRPIARTSCLGCLVMTRPPSLAHISCFCRYLRMCVCVTWHTHTYEDIFKRMRCGQGETTRRTATSLAFIVLPVPTTKTHVSTLTPPTPNHCTAH
jgi:hypothetical protein